MTHFQDTPLEKKIGGILEQVFIEQVVLELAQLKFELSEKLKSESGDDSKTWLVDKVSVIDRLIHQFDQSKIAREFSFMLNDGLDEFWISHSILSKDEVLFCGVLATVHDNLELGNFLQISPMTCMEKIATISRKIGLEPSRTLRDYTLTYLKKEFETPILRVIHKK